MKIRIAGLGGVACFCVAACSSDPKPPAPITWDDGRGSAACHSWQEAICTWAQKCGAMDQATCVEQAKSITCKTDALATQCAQTLNTLACVNPTGCDFLAMADPAPAVQACNQFMSALCSKGATCPGGQPVDQCVASLAASLNCNAAVGYTLGYEKCMADVQAINCANASFPASCDGVIKATQ